MTAEKSLDLPKRRALAAWQVVHYSGTIVKATTIACEDWEVTVEESSFFFIKQLSSLYPNLPSLWPTRLG